MADTIAALCLRWTDWFCSADRRKQCTVEKSVLSILVYKEVSWTPIAHKLADVGVVDGITGVKTRITRLQLCAKWTVKFEFELFVNLKMMRLCRLDNHQSLFFLSRGENWLEESENVVYMDMAVRSDLGPVPHCGLGSVWARALRPLLLTCLGTDETRGLLFRHLHVLLQPGRAFSRHLLLLLWHRLQALFHLQKTRKQQQSPQHHQAPPETVNSKCCIFTAFYVVMIQALWNRIL